MDHSHGTLIDVQARPEPRRGSRHEHGRYDPMHLCSRERPGDAAGGRLRVPASVLTFALRVSTMRMVLLLSSAT